MSVSAQSVPSEPGISIVTPGTDSDLAVDALLSEFPEPIHLGMPVLRKALATPRYPERARRFRKEGVVIASFVVTREGTVRDAAVLQGFFDACDAEVLRVLNSGSFAPVADSTGQVVDTRFVVGFSFKLDAP